MPPSVLVIQNDPDKSLGRLAEAFAGTGARLDVQFATGQLPDVRESSGLIVLPGLADPVDDTDAIGRARDAIDAALGAGLPILGLCLGGQLLAATTGFFHSNGVTAEKLERDAAAAEPVMRALADGIAGGFAGRLASGSV
jgi:GMP synthase (glutamine-hydrolysing)